MKKMRKVGMLLLMLAMCLIFGCDKEESSKTDDMSVKVGDVVSGFKLEKVEDNGILNSRVYTFEHEYSGATLVYVQNSDQELTFGIAYRTPHVDETDINHIFEHAILASSDKYPSKDIFFDMANKSYNSYMNAYTYNNMTLYPLCTMSEEQLIKMIDVYMNCMAAPTVIKDENFFKREALRYEMYEPDGPITMAGTVFSEDYSYMTDVHFEARDNVLNALYPGEFASNSVGMLHKEYAGLTYEKMQEVYNSFYYFDNSMIMLYGDMDYKRVMEFIDREYLSKEKDNNTDLSKWTDGKTPAGYVEAVVEAPAYEGDRTEGATRIDYAVSVDGVSYSDMMKWQIVCELLNMRNSPLSENLKANGIYGNYWAYLCMDTNKPYLQFVLNGTEKEKMEDFKKAVIQTLQEIAKEGVDKDLLESVVHSQKLKAASLRDDKHVGVSVFQTFAQCWVHTDDTNGFEGIEKAINEMEADKDQKIVKDFAEAMLVADRSALVATVPTQGAAEKIEEQMAKHLEDMKASMSEEEKDQLIKDTAAFNEWNKVELANDDFMISPSDLPEAPKVEEIEITHLDNLTIYSSNADSESLGKYKLYLDTSAVSNEEMRYFDLYQLLMDRGATKNYTADEVQLLRSRYLYNYTYEYMYPEKGESKNNHPMYGIGWYCTGEEFGESIELIMELQKNAVVDNAEEILYALKSASDYFDLSKSDPDSLLKRNAKENGIYFGLSSKYDGQIMNQQYYEFLVETQKKLTADSSYAKELAQKMRQVVDKVLVKGSVIFVSVAPQEYQEDIAKAVRKEIDKLPKQTYEGCAFKIEDGSNAKGMIAETSSNYTRWLCNFNEESGLYMPYVYALKDLYLIPKLRFQMGAYSAGLKVDMEDNTFALYSYSDPNVGATIDIIRAGAEYLEKCEMTQEQLNGYILSAYGDMILGEGNLKTPHNNIKALIHGVDLEKSRALLEDVKKATINDVKKAAQYLKEQLNSGGYVTVGTSGKIQADASYFEQVEDLRTDK